MSAADSKKTYFCTPAFGMFGSVIDLGVDLGPVRDRIQACKLRYHRELWEIICDRGIQGGGGGGGGDGEGEGGDGGGDEGGGEDGNQSNAPSPPRQQQQRLRQAGRGRGTLNSSNTAWMARKKCQVGNGGGGGDGGFQQAAPPPPAPPPGVRFQQTPLLPPLPPQPNLQPPLPISTAQPPPPPPQAPPNQRLACLMRSKAKLPPACCTIATGYLSSTSPISSPSSPSSCSQINTAEASIVIDHRKLAAAPSTITADDVSPTGSGEFVPLRCGDWSIGGSSVAPGSKKRASRQRQKQTNAASGAQK